MPSARSSACASALGRALQWFWRELDDLIDSPRSWCNQAQQNGARSTNREGTMNVRRIALACLPLTAILFSLQPAAAEVSEIRLAQQPGLSYLPLAVMEHEKLIEKHAAAAGLKDIQVKWSRFAAGNVMNDALLSGSLDIASGGVAPLITLWAKSNGQVRGVAAQTTSQIYINTRNPAVKTIKDFTDKDRIAMPAEKAFGPGNAYKLEPLTVSRSYAEGSAALLSGAGEINSAASAPPYYYKENATPGIHTVLKSYDVLGGPSTNNLLWTTKKFHDENPKLYAAFLAAYKEAINLINKDPKKGAEIFQEADRNKAYSIDDLVMLLTDKSSMQFTIVPHNVA